MRHNLSSVNICNTSRRYKDAIATFSAGDLAIVFTPDDTHFTIAKACLEHGMHVCVTKPLVHTLAQHRELAALALDRGVLSYVEVHKRCDPMYVDARARLRTFGDFSFFQASVTVGIECSCNRCLFAGVHEPAKEAGPAQHLASASPSRSQPPAAANVRGLGWKKQRHKLLFKQPSRGLPLLVHAGNCNACERLCQCEHGSGERDIRS